MYILEAFIKTRYTNIIIIIMSYSAAAKQQNPNGEENKLWTDIIDEQGEYHLTYTKEEIHLLNSLKNYVNTLLKEERPPIIKQEPPPPPPPIIPKDNTIQLEFCKNNKIILRGDKTKYGLIVGPSGTTFTKLSNKYKTDKIYIPKKETNCNEIVVQGTNALTIVYDIMKILTKT